MTDKERDPEAIGPEGAAEPEAAADAAATPDADETLNGDSFDPLDNPEDAPVDDAVGAAPAGTTGERQARFKGKGVPGRGLPGAAPSIAQEAVHVQDRASAWFVIITVGVFVAILAFGLLFGHKGFVSNVLATPKPVPSVDASVPPSVAPSVAPSVSPSVGPSAAPSASASTAPSAAPSASASAAASAEPGVSPSAAPASPSPAAS